MFPNPTEQRVAPPRELILVVFAKAEMARRRPELSVIGAAPSFSCPWRLAQRGCLGGGVSRPCGASTSSTCGQSISPALTLRSEGQRADRELLGGAELAVADHAHVAGLVVPDDGGDLRVREPLRWSGVVFVLLLCGV